MAGQARRRPVGGDLVARKKLRERRGDPLVEQHAHAQEVWLLRAACTSTASICARLTPGNHSRNCSTVAPPSRFSKRALTGTRVPPKTHAPATFCGSRSTALQVAHRGYVLETGRIALADDAKVLRGNEQVRKTYLGEV